MGYHTFANERLGVKPDHEFGDFDDRAKSLVDQLLNEDSQTRMMSVYGPWGSGKSHYLNWIGHYLSEKNQLACYFNAWEYEAEGDLASVFLRCLASKENYYMPEKAQSFKKSFLPNPTVVKKLAWDVTKIIGGILANQLPTYASSAANSFIQVLIDAQEGEKVVPSKTALELIHYKVDQIINSICGKKRDRVFILVDDLDRCSPDNAIRLLEWYKNHLTHPKCTYILGVDLNATAVLVNGKYSQYLSTQDRDSNSFGYQYLAKLFEKLFRVPQVNRIEELALLASNYQEESLTQWLKSTYDVELTESLTDSIIKNNNISTPRRAIKDLARYKLAISSLLSNISHFKNKSPDSFSVSRSVLSWWLLVFCFLFERDSPTKLKEFLDSDPCTALKNGDISGFIKVYEVKDKPRELFLRHIYNVAKLNASLSNNLESRDIKIIYDVVNEL